MTSLRVWVMLLALAWSPWARADDVSQAREHYTRASNAYDLGHFAEAAREFEAAYQLKNDPALLFNIGQAYRFDGKYQQALLAYRAYLRRLPGAPNRTQVESSMAELQELVDKQKANEQRPPTGTLAPTGETAAPATATVATAAPAPRRDQPVYKKWWLWTAVGGAVAIGLGVGLGVGLSGGGSTARALPPVGGGL